MDRRCYRRAGTWIIEHVSRSITLERACIASFRLIGDTTSEGAGRLQQRLEAKFGIFRVVR